VTEEDKEEIRDSAFTDVEKNEPERVILFTLNVSKHIDKDDWKMLQN